MGSEYKQSEEELQQHLTDTLKALELSASAFDRGYEGEAKRLAAAIRVLVHDTPNSKSLLGQLGRKSMQFYDTSIPRHPGTIPTYNGITAMDITQQEAMYVAPLDDLPADSPPRYITFDQWWNMVIFVDEARRETTRKDLILAVANKDGGAHVDPVLDSPCSTMLVRNDEVPVVPMVATRNQGTEELLQEIVRAAENKVQARELRLRYDEHVEEELAKLEKLISQSELSRKYSPRWLAIKLLEEDEEIIKKFKEMKVG